MILFSISIYLSHDTHTHHHFSSRLEQNPKKAEDGER